MDAEYYRICRECLQPSRAKAKDCDHCHKPMPEAIEIFLSYAHEDEKLLAKLMTHLKILQRLGLAMLWYDQDIGKGSSWEPEIYQRLNTADIILLLISSDFIASDFCYSKEMDRAMERHARNEACVIPVILRPTNWQNAPFATLQAAPKFAKPVTTWKDTDSAFVDISRALQDTIEKRFGITLSSHP